jgi:PAS domain S-box-containing protein
MATKLTLKNHWLARYAAALAAVGFGFLVRVGLAALVGEGLPTYITFYPVIMAVALFGGFGPGLVATLATTLAVDYWILPPTHAFGIVRVVDGVGLAFFTGMGVFMSAVAALYRRARQKTVTYDTAIFEWEGQEPPRPPLGETVLLVGGLVLALAILGMLGWRTYRNLAVTVQADRLVSHTYIVDEELEHLFMTVQDMESSEQGYLIMGEEDYLRPYDAAKQTVAAQIGSLKRLTADNPDQTQRLKYIEALVDAKLTELREIIEMRRSQGLEAVHTLMATGKGKVLSEEIRTRMIDAEEDELRLLHARTIARDADFHKALLTLLAGGVLSLLLLMTVFVFLMQENRRRRRAEAELRRHGEDLQKTVTARTAELSEANEFLGRSEQQFRTLADSIPNLAWWANGDGYITWYNQRWYEYTGTTPKQMEGWGWQSVHDPQILPSVIERWKASLATGQPFDMTFPLRGADGVFRPFLTRVMPLKDAQGRVQQWFGTNTDVSEQKRAEEAHARLAAIVESSDDAILAKSLDGTITSWNVGAERLLGYTAEEAIGRSICFLLPPERHDEENQIMARLQAGERVEHFETARLTKDGRRLSVSVTSSPLKDGEGRIIGVSKIMRDITERKQAEDAVQHLNAELRQRVADLQAANEEVQASRRAALSLAEDALEARKEAERVNADLQKAVQSLAASRRAAYNLMGDAVQARNQAEQANAALMKLNRALKVHSKIDQALMRANGETEFLEAVCRIVVEDCGHVMVWVGLAEEDEARTVRPIAQAGFEAGYLETLEITWADTERGRGPTGTAIRTGQPSRCRNMLTDPRFAPWQAEAIKRGYASSLVLPLLGEGRAFGSLTIYSKHPDGFSDDEVTLLTELAGDLAYGITALRLRAAKERAEEAQRQSEERYRSLVELSPEALFVNRKGRIVLVNPAALQLFGAASADQLLGKSPFDIFHRDCHTIMRERISQVLAGQRVPVLEEKIVRLDGVVVDVEVVATPVMDQGERAIQVLLRDITRRKQARAALQKTTEDLTRSNRDLEQFAYVASHDLQEPLRAVGGYVKLLQLRFPDKLDAKAQGYIAGAFEGATRMEQLIRDLLAFSRVATRGDAFLPADLEDALGQALRNLEASLNSAQAIVAHDPLPTLAVDAGQIRQLFQNLVGNAIKFHGEQPPKIHIAAKRQDGRWEFSVRDNGIGIEPQYFEKIFQIFQRLHTRKDYPGTGIGLAICKRIVERHGGALWVESQLGHGSTFYFSLPDTAANTALVEPG